MWSDLPKEVLFDILLKLPVRTLIVCSTLSKQHHSVITSPEFIAAHIKNNTTHLLLRYVVKDDRQQIKERFFFEPDDENFSGFNDEGAVELPFDARGNGWFTVLGSINGVICLVNDLFSEWTLLWNPSIKKFVEVPEPIYVFDNVGGYESVSGFGFDPILNDYKVVRIVDVGPRFWKNKLVEVYSLKSGCWRGVGSFDINYHIRGFGSVQRYQPCSLHDCVYWVGSDLSVNVIIKFNVSTERFEIIEFPTSLNGRWRSRYFPALFVQDFGGKLGLVHRDNKAVTFCVWVKNEGGVVDSWTKIINLNFTGLWQMPRAFGFRISEEIIMVKGGDRRYDRCMNFVVAFDRKQDAERTLGEINGDGSSFYLSTYVESMALFVEGKGLAPQLCNGAAKKRKKTRA